MEDRIHHLAWCVDGVSVIAIFAVNMTSYSRLNDVVGHILSTHTYGYRCYYCYRQSFSTSHVGRALPTHFTSNVLWTNLIVSQVHC